MFQEYYREQFREIFDAPLGAEDGIDEGELRDRLAKADLWIPRALFDYHLLAGRHWINTNHNRLFPVEELDWMDDKLVFMEENQVVAFWGIDRSDIENADPIVWQGVNGESIEWYPEEYRVSRFLMAMWKWTMTGEL